MKLVNLRWTTADLLFLEHLGNIVWKDQVIVPLGQSKNFATFGEMMVMPATKDLWARTTSMTTVMFAVNGLLSSIDLLLHPNILSAGRNQAMFRQLLYIYSQTNCKADPDHIYDVFDIRFQQHVETVREFPKDPRRAIQDLVQWKGRAQIPLRILKDQAKRDCELSIQGYKQAKGETGEGVAPVKMEGVDEDMNITPYRRGEALPKDKPHDQHRLGGKSMMAHPHPAPVTN